MDNDDSHRLSQIETVWSVVQRATSGDQLDRHSAQVTMLKIYGQSIRRYLGACLSDAHAADEVFQEFALKLSRGDFAGVEPARGRFRSFVKSVLYRLVIDHHRQGKRARQTQSLDVGLFDPAAEQTDDFASDARFEQIWKEGLLQQAWQQLRDEQDERGHLYHSLLRLRVDHTDWTYAQLVDALTAETGKRIASSAVRVTLHRARRRFAEHLLNAVAASMPDTDVASLEDELISLHLIQYCRDVLRARV